MALVENSEAVAVMAAAGNLDMQARGLALNHVPVLKQNEEAGNYTVSLWSSDGASSIGLQPNQSYADPKYRELMQNRDFRYAMSMAIDRDLINDIAYLGQATPTTQSVGPSTSWYVDDMAPLKGEYGEYDVAGAQQLLEESVGVMMGDDGFYTFPDGSELTLIIESSDTAGPNLDALELIVDQLNDAGLHRSHYRGGNAGHAWHDLGGDGAEFSGAGVAAAHHQLGCADQGCARFAVNCTLPLGLLAGDFYCRGYFGL